MRAVSCHQDVRACRNHPGTGSAPQSGSSRSSLRNTHRVDREVQCNATFRALDKAGISYETIDVTQNPDAREYVMSLGYLAMPVVHLSPTQHGSGFRPDRLRSVAAA
jgi:glutaredoxin-like protein NrdH